MINFLQFSEEQTKLQIAEVTEKATGLPIWKSAAHRAECAGCALGKERKRKRFFFWEKR